MQSTPRLTALVLAIACSLPFAVQAQAAKSTVTIEQSRGIDQRVDYPSLTRFGPWDDRNYMLTAEDVAMLPEDDYYLHNVPAFFKVEHRKRSPEMQGWNMYPKSLDQEFQIRYGGLMQNGVVIPDGLGKQNFALPREGKYQDATRTAPVLSNIVLDAGSNRNECTIEYNPANQDRVIAGCNGGGGQEQYWSADGGATWTVAGTLPSTCCDPALEWSVDGTVAYSATLGNAGGLRATVFRSTDNGQTWGNRIDVSSAASDKEWIHVDRSPTSPHRDNVYLTWHQGNVMQFARSTNRGQSWSTPIAFPGAPRGIGSDISTAPDGTIYYFYPSLTNTTGGGCAPATPCNIMLLKSTDGGASFVNPNGQVVLPMRGRFEAGVPSMETRRTFFYISTDVDFSTGPRRGRVYISWTDLSLRSPANNAATATNTNNVRIRVAWSDDGGNTWTETPAPHEIESTTQDSCASGPACIDRYHQWIDVDDNGVLHIGYYDTRNDLPNRGRVDFYYTYSRDGGATWELPATRVSTATSNNITNGQEWGDYNGLAVSLIKNKVMTVWTDNRTGQGQKAVAAEIQNITAATFGINAPTTAVKACAGQTAGPTPLTLTTTLGSASGVTLSTPSAPAAFGTATFNPNPVIPSAGGTVTQLSVPIQANATAGNVDLPVRGVAGNDTVNLSVPYQIWVGTPGTLTLTAPAAGATDVPTSVSFNWTAASNNDGHRIEVSRQADFANLVYAADVSGTTFTPAPTLRPGTQYFWRVRGSNVCGNGNFASGSFTTAGTGVIFTDGFPE